MARTYNSGWRDWFNTAHADINGNFIVEGLQEQMVQLDALLASNPQMEAKMRRVISKVLVKATKWTQKQIGGKMPNDPRHAAKAVRKAVYRRILGGNINILSKRRASVPKIGSYRPTRTLKSGQRGGNRRSRNERTIRMDSYQADDRGFILRFLESGARRGGGDRKMGAFQKDEHRSDVKRGSQGGNISRYGNIGKVNTGNRGHINATNIFSSNLISLGNFINQELNKEFNELLKNPTSN